MTYDFKYGEDTPYARAVALLGRHRRPGGALVLDLGCGYGAIAEPVARLGLTYLGVDAEPASTDALVRRGFEAAVGDLAAPESLTIDLERAIADRPVAAICMLDVIEHLSDPEAALARLWDLAQRLGAPPLVVSIPNVTHLDLGVKLLLGRWDVTPTGLLDATHLRFFSEAHLNETMGRTGWTEIESADFELTVSDQHFPPDAVPLERSTPVGSFLTTLREHAGPGALVNQFVRAYRPEGPPRPVAPDARAGGPETLAPWVSVLVRTRAQRPDTFQETLLCLAAQTCDDFEVLVLAHDVAAERLEEIQALIDQFDQTFSRRVRVVSVHGGGRSRPLNEGARLARGRYLATLDDDDLAFAHWVESLKATALRAPGRVLHIGVANQPIADQAGTDGYTVVGRPQCPYPLIFDQVDHLSDNRTPNCGFAVPRSLVSDLGEVWDESLPVYEDWEYLLRASALCGVESERTIGALVRVWVHGDRSTTVHSESEWTKARMAVIARVDAHPLLMAPGAMTRLRRLIAHAEQADGQQWRADVIDPSNPALYAALEALEEARRDLAQLRASTSWRAMALPRFIAGMARQAILRRRRRARG